MTRQHLSESESLMRLYAPEECTGKDGYPPEWHATVKHAVREQADHRCIRCMHPYVKGAGGTSPCDDRCDHEGPFQFLEIDGLMVRHARWRILTVHHLDGVKGNLRWWNLVSLCQRCHLQIQGKVKMERVYPWPHSDWFQPYVAGYYAWTYLGEEITRV
jgi:5-methylcytosine-specific restriction endonuclease McrA